MPSFYDINKDFTPVFPKLDIKDDVELTNMLFTVKVPYIELDIELDLLQWKHEAGIAKAHLVNHREEQNHNGWRSCCIHGLGVEKTGIWNKYTDKDEGYHWTTLSDLTPTIKQFWLDFPFEKLYRVRFMELNGNGFIDAHNDSPNGVPDNLLNHIIPVNIAIDHPNDCHFVLEKLGIVPFNDGKANIINITNTHSVVNFSNKPRMHLIAHGFVGNKIEEFSKLIARSYRKQYGRISKQA
jgi:hypothetical protein